MIARSVTHISDELKPNKYIVYGQIGTYVHVLFITNYVKYIVYFNESILPNRSHTYLYNIIYFKMMKYHYLYSYLYYTPMCITGDEMASYEETVHYVTIG